MQKIMKTFTILLLPIAILAQTGISPGPKQIEQAKNKNLTALLDKQIVKEWLNYLASDSMKGRKNGSNEMKKIAEWIAGNFESYGLKPFKEYNGYLQQYYIKKGKDSVVERNVIGYLEGSDPKLKNEYIVISAHFDHLGIGKPVNGDSIYNGANDDASGVCALLGIAKLFQTTKEKPGRSIVFAAFSGEEISANGSRYFVKHMSFPVSSIYLNMNIEMIGLCTNLGPNNYVVTGSSYSTLKDMLHEYNKGNKWKLIDTIKKMDDYFFKADNVAFANIKRDENIVYGVQAHSFVTWNGEVSLHKPFDEVKDIDFDNMTGFIQYLAGVTIYLSDCKVPVEWTDTRLIRIEKQ